MYWARQVSVRVTIASGAVAVRAAVRADVDNIAFLDLTADVARARFDVPDCLGSIIAPVRATVAGRALRELVAGCLDATFFDVGAKRLGVAVRAVRAGVPDADAVGRGDAFVRVADVDGRLRVPDTPRELVAVPRALAARAVICSVGDSYEDGRSMTAVIAAVVIKAGKNAAKRTNFFMLPFLIICILENLYLDRQ